MRDVAGPGTLPGLALCALLLTLLFCMAPAARAGDGEVVNAMCPVMTDEPVDAEIYLDHAGKTVFFCCAKCRRLFVADPDKYIANLPQFGGSPAATTPPPQPTADPAAQTPSPPEPQPVVPEATEPPPQATPESQPPAAHLEDADDDDDEDDATAAAPTRARTVPALERLGRFHVVAVHFPIGLLLIAAGIELFRPKRPDHPAAFTVRLLAWLGAAGALIAMTLGLIHEEAVESTYGAIAEQTLELHEWSGIAVAIAAVLAAIALQVRAVQPATLVARLAAPLLYIVALAVAFTGHLGGTLVYGRDFLIPW